MSTLGDYLSDTRRLLKDSGALYSDNDLLAWIGRSIQQRDLELGVHRTLVHKALTANTFRYSMLSVLATGVILAGPATNLPLDVVSIVVIPIGTSPSSGIRYPLGRWPYSRLAYLLSTAYPTYPVKYALYGTDTVVLAPPPAAAYDAEWDFTTVGPLLTATTDTDPLPYPWTDPIPFLAASFAKEGAQRFDEAQAFLALYTQRLALVRARSRPFAVADPWSDLGRR